MVLFNRTRNIKELIEQVVIGDFSVALQEAHIFHKGRGALLQKPQRAGHLVHHVALGAMYPLRPQVHDALAELNGVNSPANPVLCFEDVDIDDAVLHEARRGRYPCGTRADDEHLAVVGPRAAIVTATSTFGWKNTKLFREPEIFRHNLRCFRSGFDFAPHFACLGVFYSLTQISCDSTTS